MRRVKFKDFIINILCKSAWQYSFLVIVKQALGAINKAKAKAEELKLFKELTNSC